MAEKIRAARQAALQEPDSAVAVGRLGMVFHAHELHSEAVTCYRRAAELAPREVRWPYLAALATAKTDLAGAIAHFEAAATLGGGAVVHLGLGDALAQLGRGEEAVAQYRRAAELDPESSHALLGLARLALAGGEAAAAASQLERAAEIAPHHGEVHGLLAQAYRRLGREAEADRELLRAAAFDEPRGSPDPFLEAVRDEAVNSRAFSERGQRLARGGRFAEAEAEFRRVLQIRPGNARDHSNLGGALAGQGRLQEAVAAYESALEVDPEDAYALNNLGLALAQQGALEEAASRLERAAALDPSYIDPLRNLGLLRSRQGRHDEAIGLFRRALAADPGAVEVYNDLGTALAGQGELAEAMSLWQEVLEIDPRQLNALYNLATAHAMRGEHAEAVGRLRTALEIAPNSSRLVTLLAWELATAPRPDLRDADEAERLARRVVEAQPGRPQPADVLAAALAAQGRFDEAAALARKALAQAQRSGPPELAAQIAARLELYRQRRPFAQRPGTTARPQG